MKYVYLILAVQIKFIILTWIKKKTVKEKILSLSRFKEDNVI